LFKTIYGWVTEKPRTSTNNLKKISRDRKNSAHNRKISPPKYLIKEFPFLVDKREELRLLERHRERRKSIRGEPRHIERPSNRGETGADLGMASGESQKSPQIPTNLHCLPGFLTRPRRTERPGD